MKTNIIDLITDKARLGRAMAGIIEEIDIKNAEIVEWKSKLEKMQNEYETLEKAIAQAMETEKE